MLESRAEQPATSAYRSRTWKLASDRAQRKHHSYARIGSRAVERDVLAPAGLERVGDELAADRVIAGEVVFIREVGAQVDGLACLGNDVQDAFGDGLAEHAALADHDVVARALVEQYDRVRALRGDVAVELEVSAA